MPKGVYIRGEKTKQVPKCHPNNKYKALGLCQSCYVTTKVNPERVKERHLKSYYGITVAEYNILFEVQNGCCAICGVHDSIGKRHLSVDHSHITGRVRGLLCGNCNSILGFSKDQIDVLKRSIEYLEK